MSVFKNKLSTLLLPLRIFLFLGKGNLFSAERIQILATSYRVLWSIVRGNRKAAVLQLWFQNTPVSVVLESSADFALIREVFLDEEYKHEKREGVKNIFDVGANVGVASLYFHILYPQATVYAFEPDPLLFQKLAERVSGIPQIKPLQIALGDSNGEVLFYRHKGSPLAGSLLKRSEDETPFSVVSRTISSIVTELSIDAIDILKFDIEGAERMLFASQSDREFAQFLIGEAHLDLLAMDKIEFQKLFPNHNCTYVRQTTESRYIVHIYRP